MEKDKKNQEQNITQAAINKEIEIKTAPDLLVPKYCNSININLLKEKSVVLTMAYSEGDGERTALITRIIINLEHAKKFNELLTQIIAKADEY